MPKTCYRRVRHYRIFKKMVWYFTHKQRGIPLSFQPQRVAWLAPQNYLVHSPLASLHETACFS